MEEASAMKSLEALVVLGDAVHDAIALSDLSQAADERVKR
jgi:hypothetical protein